MTVYIIVEGPTEEEFVNNSLSHHLAGLGIDNTLPILLETSPGFSGGDITYSRYSTNVRKLLLSDPNAVVTSLIDFFRLRSDFPGYAAAAAVTNKNDRVAFLENEIALDIPDERFLPYIQLHEFEGLLFSEMRGFQYVLRLDQQRLNKIHYVINHNPNPEMINDGPETAPSVRLKGLIPRYKKTFHGPLIALENGIAPVLAKCPRFNNWITELVDMCNNA
jgi:hypothetical protein